MTAPRRRPAKKPTLKLPPPDARWLKPSEVAAEWRVSLRWVNRLIESGELPAKSVGPRTRRISREDADQYRYGERADSA